MYFNRQISMNGKLILVINQPIPSHQYQLLTIQQVLLSGLRIHR